MLLGSDNGANYSKGASGPMVAADGSGNAIAVWSQVGPSGSDILASRYSAGSSWSTPTAIGAGSGNDSNPRIAMDASGNATVVWVHDPSAAGEGLPARIWASLYDPAGGWGASTEIWGTGSARDPQVAMDPMGNAIAVWSAADGANWTVWAARYVAGTGWGTSEPIGPGASGWEGPQIAIGSQGDAIAVWVSWDGTRENLVAKRFVVGTGWDAGAALSIGAPAGDFFLPQVAMDSAGNAVVVWVQVENTSQWSVWANRFSLGNGWGSAIHIGDAWPAHIAWVKMDPAGNAFVVWTGSQGDAWARRYVAGLWETSVSLGEGYYPQIDVDTEGNAIAVWRSGNGFASSRYVAGVGWGNRTGFPATVYGYYPSLAIAPEGNAFLVWENERWWEGGFSLFPTIAMSQYSSPSGWGPPMRLDRGATRDAFDSQIAPYGQGNAIAVWCQGDGSRYGVWTSRYLAGVGWVTAIRVDKGEGDALHPQVGVDAQGNAIVAWEQWDNIRPSIWANWYVAGAGWGVPTPIDESAGGASEPQVAVSPIGKAIVVWLRWDGDSRDVWASRYAVGAGWSGAEEVETQLGQSHSPQVAVGDLGDAVVVWQQSTGGTYPGLEGIWSNRYVISRGWEAATLISSGVGAADLGVDVDPAGNAIATWWAPGIYADRFVLGSGWEGAVPVVTEPCWAWWRVSVAMDARGNSFIIYEGEDRTTEAAPEAAPAMHLGRFCVSAIRYIAGIGWETSTELDVDATSPGIAVDRNGNAIAVWNRFEEGLMAKWYLVGVGWSDSAFVNGSERADALSSRQIAVGPAGTAFVVWQREEVDRSTVWANQRTLPAPSSLEITSPTATVTNSPTVTVSGTAWPGAHLTVNEVFVAVDSWGDFTYTVTLPDGTYMFVVTAQDSYGNVTTRTVTITVDTLAPRLMLRSPVDGLVTNAATVDVCGTTEPGATLVVNGLVVAIEDNGSFSTRLGLAVGENTITATAEDAAGNAARISVNVTHVNPLIAELGQMKWLAFGALAVVVALVGFFVLYTKPWRRRSSAIPSDPDDIGPVAPAGTSTTAGLLQPAGGALDLDSHRHVVERRWPAQTCANGVRLIAKERILLHLLHYARYADSPEVPPELTQERIAEATGIGQRHFAQYGRPLLEDGLLVARSARVRGTVQRRKVYNLSEDGRRKALEIRDRLRSVMVRIRDDSGERVVTIAEALLDARGSMSILDILRESIETGIVDIRH